MRYYSKKELNLLTKEQLKEALERLQTEYEFLDNQYSDLDDSYAELEDENYKLQTFADNIDKENAILDVKDFIEKLDDNKLLTEELKNYIEYYMKFFNRE